MSKKKTILLIALLVLMFIGSFTAIIYPLFSSWYSQQNQSEVLVDHQQSVEGNKNEEIEAAFAAARDYNERLDLGKFSPLDYEENGYFDLVNLTGTGIMGSVEIPKINVNLPIYHGTGDEALAKGAGHMEQTSLPVGGENTHAVISAHTGMPSNVMFTDLPLMEEGDIFYITVMGVKMAYQVDQVKMVLPHQIEEINIEEGRDLVTLTTCAPYGSNTHRLLVRGTRISLEEAPDTPAGTPEKPQDNVSSVWREKYLEGIFTGLAWAVGILLVFNGILFIYLYRKRKAEEAAAVDSDPDAESDSNPDTN